MAGASVLTSIVSDRNYRVSSVSALRYRALLEPVIIQIAPEFSKVTHFRYSFTSLHKCLLISCRLSLCPTVLGLHAEKIHAAMAQFPRRCLESGDQVGKPTPSRAQLPTLILRRNRQVNHEDCLESGHFKSSVRA